MLLYHYATTAYSRLETVGFRTTLSNEERDDGLKKSMFRHEPGPYYAHISFFIEPLRLDLLGDLYKPFNHPFWFNGNEVYEHVVESNKIGNLLYVLCETPAQDLLSDRLWKTPMSMEDKAIYFKAEYDMRVSKGYEGKTNRDLEHACIPFVGKTYSFQQALVKRTDGTEIGRQYAPCVPHLMVYPSNGFCPLVSKPKKIKIGDKAASKDW